MLVRPSLVLQIKLMPEDYSEASVAEIKRSFIYLAQSIITELPPEEQADGNIMRLSIRLMRPYWNMGDPKAQELWEGVMPQWLRNVTRNMSTAMHNFNCVLHPVGSGNVVYNWVDYEFGQDALLRIKVDGENRITKDAPAFAEKARTLLNRKAFGEKAVARIRIPSLASYEAQVEAAVQAGQERQAAEMEQERAEVGQTEALPEDREDELAGGVDGVKVGKGAEDDALVDVEDGETKESPAELPFEIDFGIWGIEYEDGTVVEYDARS